VHAIRRALARLVWTVVRIAARYLALAGAAVIRKAVDLELAADEGLQAPAPRPLIAFTSTTPVQPKPKPAPAYRVTVREDNLASFCGAHGRGLFVVSDDHAALIANAGRC
jgi:hypothetical protein